jgi:hypothetical protein
MISFALFCCCIDKLAHVSRTTLLQSSTPMIKKISCDIMSSATILSSIKPIWTDPRASKSSDKKDLSEVLYDQWVLCTERENVSDIY